MTKLIILLFALSASTLSIASPQGVEEKLKRAMNADIRSAAEVSRDKNRKPRQTLAFFGLEDDMRVLELFPGGGWYTKLLAPVLNEKGKLYEAMGTGRIERLKEQDGFNNMEILSVDAQSKRDPGSMFYSLSSDKLDFGVNNLDIVFTFRNYHNFSADTRALINDAAYKSLKSGGIYAVVDHTRRHMQETNNENRRRIDPVLAIKEIQAAGFILEDYSMLHYRLDDELRYEVGRKSVTGNTDRFTLKFRKP